MADWNELKRLVERENQLFEDVTPEAGEKWPDAHDELAAVLVGGCFTKTILALIAENERLSRFERAWDEWQQKTEWVQQTAEPKELGMHRADVLRKRIDQLGAELERVRAALREIDAIVDGNIREIVRDLVNRDAGLNNGANPNDIYDECDRIDEAIDAAMGKGGRADA